MGEGVGAMGILRCGACRAPAALMQPLKPARMTSDWHCERPAALRYVKGRRVRINPESRSQE